ncbi:lipopolysaccharide export system protein LptA [Bartonella silvatica]|uniref:Lipopolysaccharide export system protein LptA n=1 Tax=Bartonella silvatica TaxID=357760 RepID=A0ABV2HES8_9HYPH
MKLKKSYKKLMSIALAFIIGILGFETVCSYAEVTHFGMRLSDNNEPVELHANSLEVRDKEGIALFKGDVSVNQGERLLRAAKLIIYYDKTQKMADLDKIDTKMSSPSWLNSSGIKKIEALGKVYIKVAAQTATGDKGVFDGKSKTMSLTGSNVVLTDGNNVATGCKLTADMKSGKAFLEGCKTSKKRGRVSIILKQSQENGH